MRAPNHIAGGIVFTAFVSSFFEANPIESWGTISIVVFGSLLPDIDHTKSIIGKVFLPISKWLNKRYGHRTITHSIFALFLVSLISSFIESTFFGSRSYSLFLSLAYLSHLIFDMMTVQGVPLLYPWKKNKFVLPGDANFRISNQDNRAEAIVFCSFIVLGISMWPLFQNGFWTTYNRSFGTPKHLVAEFHDSEDLLSVEYKLHRGSRIYEGTGFCVHADENEIILFDEDQSAFKTITSDKFVVDRVVPSHTDRKYVFDELKLHEVGLDSLNKILSNQIVIDLEVYASDLVLVKDGFVSKETRSFKANYVSNLSFELIPDLFDFHTFVSDYEEIISSFNGRILNLKRRAKFVKKYYEEIGVSEYVDIPRSEYDYDPVFNEDYYDREVNAKDLEAEAKDLEKQVEAMQRAFNSLNTVDKKIIERLEVSKEVFFNGLITILFIE